MYTNMEKFKKFPLNVVIKTSDLKEIGTTDRTGTTVRFKPDAQIFETTIFEFDVLKTRLQELAFLNKGLRITLSDKRGEGRSESFHYEGGLVQFIEYLNEAKEAITPSVIPSIILVTMW